MATCQNLNCSAQGLYDEYMPIVDNPDISGVGVSVLRLRARLTALGFSSFSGSCIRIVAAIVRPIYMAFNSARRNGQEAFETSLLEMESKSIFSMARSDTKVDTLDLRSADCHRYCYSGQWLLTVM
jgi:hypothetical protein